MRILIISNLYPPHFLGGYELLCREAVNWLAGKGHEIIVLTSTHGVEQVKAGTEQGVQVYRKLRLEVPFDQSYSFHPLRRWRTGRFNAACTAETVRRFQPDVVYLWSLLRLTVSPAEAAARMRIPLVWSFNDANILAYRDRPSSGSLPSHARRFLCRFLLPGSSLDGLSFGHATVISESLREDLRGGGLPVGSVKTIYQGIHPEDFPLRQGAGTISDPMRVCYAGQLHEYKGVHTAIEAVSRFAGRHGRDSIRLIVAGDGPEDYVARLKAASANLQVDFLGRLPASRMPEVYRKNDVFLFPSTWREPFGLTHLEAMASGLAVISTMNGGQGEFLVDGENCLAFPPNNAGALHAALERLRGDAALVSRLVKNGRELVEKEFAIERYLDDLERLVLCAVETAP